MPGGFSYTMKNSLTSANLNKNPEPHRCATKLSWTACCNCLFEPHACRLLQRHHHHVFGLRLRLIEIGFFLEMGDLSALRLLLALVIPCSVTLRSVSSFEDDSGTFTPRCNDTHCAALVSYAWCVAKVSANSSMGSLCQWFSSYANQTTTG